MNYFDRKTDGKYAKIININFNKTYFSFFIYKDEIERQF